MDTKPVSYAQFKKLSKLSLNEFNRWAAGIYKSGYLDGLEFAYEHRMDDIRTDPQIASFTEEEITSVLDGLGLTEEIVDEIVDKLLEA